MVVEEDVVGVVRGVVVFVVLLVHDPLIGSGHGGQTEAYVHHVQATYCGHQTSRDAFRKHYKRSQNYGFVEFTYNLTARLRSYMARIGVNSLT